MQTRLQKFEDRRHHWGMVVTISPKLRKELESLLTALITLAVIEAASAIRRRINGRAR